MDSADQQFAWLIRLSDRLDHLDDVLTRDEGQSLDFSAESLGVLERYLHGRYGDQESIDADEEAEWIVEGAAAYTGELLMRLAGGRWDQETEPATWRVPPIHADPALKLPAVAPLELALTAARGGGPALTRSYTEWNVVVGEKRLAEPSWEPVKQPTIGVDPPTVEASESAYLADWLAAQERAFPAWADRFGTAAGWDFSRESLVALGALVLRVLPGPDAFRDPANLPFREVAAWYGGETMRRSAGGHWKYRHGDPETTPFAGWPYLRRRLDDGAFGQPYLAIQLGVDWRDPDLLVQQYDLYIQ
ncbi:hypothetical protein Aab01nite_53600 [Paractinoplanes abujensis]|uniref:Uncharacterized protein n=1 Tax=Paractinoplanes abujensis TaxID=882441 RepID=A0A7W7CRV7_9ACTN|nr:hypothetical protein [Actinoplanes abujensis]MBB4693571.1 hypothetical protein [Actinoplanes abujensis]GID21770.1 hypothetical protein Aab01nite_53600 [Actinoplanes abujensis]